MKQAKLVLTAVGVLAVIGGALAFKASRQQNTFYTETKTTINGVPRTYCTVETQLFYTVDPQGLTSLTASIAPTFTTCPVLKVRIDG